MYAGRIVELAETSDLFARPLHPYTAALLAAVPRVSDPSHTRLRSIPGQPPDLRAIPAGCAFAPRCAHARPRCSEERPELVTGPPTIRRSVACHFPLGPDDALDAPERDELRGGLQPSQRRPGTPS